MDTLTPEQHQGAVAAKFKSKKAFERAGKMPTRPERLEAFAEQAETFLREIDALRVPPTHPLVEDYVRMGTKNIEDWDRYTTHSLQPHVQPQPDPELLHAPRNCPMPDCTHVGPPGTCPTHDQT